MSGSRLESQIRLFRESELGSWHQTLAGIHRNRTVSARLLGVSVRTLGNKISEYSAEGFHIPRPESRDKSAETIVPTNTHPKDKAAAMSVALASMRRVAASDCGS